MTHLAKLNLKSVQRESTSDPALARRRKLATALDEQMHVVAAAKAGEQYHATIRRWQKNEAGEKVPVHTEKRVRPWFFEQDGGWYVQCRYGSRVLPLNGKSNAVFVEKLEEVAPAFDALKAAAMAGELDAAINEALKTAPRGRKVGSKTVAPGSVAKH